MVMFIQVKMYWEMENILMLLQFPSPVILNTICREVDLLIVWLQDSGMVLLQGATEVIKLICHPYFSFLYQYLF